MQEKKIELYGIILKYNLFLWHIIHLFVVFVPNQVRSHYLFQYSQVVLFMFTMRLIYYDQVWYTISAFGSCEYIIQWCDYEIMMEKCDLYLIVNLDKMIRYDTIM